MSKQAIIDEVKDYSKTLYKSTNTVFNSILGINYEEKSRLLFKSLNFKILTESNKEYKYTTIYAGEIDGKLNYYFFNHIFRVFTSFN